MNKFLVSGCSFTHALETASISYDIKNINYSYAKFIADHLHAEYTNVAYPGASNELIFHRTITEITQHDYTHCLVAWTSLHREAWEKDDVVWAFNLKYGNCTDNKSDEKPFIKKYLNVYLQSNIKENLEAVVRYWKVFAHKTLNDELDKKLNNYRKAIQTICQIKNIHLVEINSLNNSESSLECIQNMDVYKTKGTHPTIQEHKLIGERIIKTYYHE